MHEQDQPDQGGTPADTAVNQGTTPAPSEAEQLEPEATEPEPEQIIRDEPIRPRREGGFGGDRY